MCTYIITSTCWPSWPKALAGLFHRLSFALLQYTLSTVVYFASPLGLIMLFNIRWILSEFSLEIKAYLGLCKAIRLSVRIAVKCWRKFQILTKTTRDDENPWTLANAFFAFKHHDKGKSKSSCWSSGILSCILAVIMLCHSTNAILNGDSAEVTLTFMFMASHISKNWLLAN